MAKQTHVSASFAQDFASSEKAQARANIDAASTAVATQSTDGLMSSTDKTRLDSIQPPVQSSWIETDQTSLAYIQDKPTFASVAYSGDYNDLVNVPYLGAQFTPVVYNVTTYAEFNAMLEAGKNVILVGSDGNIVGRYKYSTNNTAIFERCPNVQPMWMAEFFLTESGWETHHFYVTDMADPRVYTVDRVGTEYKQTDLPKMSFDISSYFASTHWQYQGADISGSMFDEFVTRKPQLVRYDYSTDLVYLLRGAPVGTPTAVATVELVLSYAATQNSDYVDVVQDWAPKIVIPFTDFTDSGQGTAYLSQQKQLNYSVTFDRQRFESLFASSYYAYFWLRCTISNIAPPGASHDMRQVAAHSQWTFYEHV